MDLVVFPRIHLGEGERCCALHRIRWTPCSRAAWPRIWLRDPESEGIMSNSEMDYVILYLYIYIYVYI